MSKIFIDENGYPRYKDTGRLVHRSVAFREYKKNRHLYPESFGSYQVHHINENKRDFSENNLQIVTPEQHDAIHGKSGNRSTSFGSVSEHGEYRNRNMSFGEMLSMIIVCVGCLIVYYGSHDFSKSPTQINYFTGTVAIGVGIILVAVAWLALSKLSTQAIFCLTAAFILLAFYSFGLHSLQTGERPANPASSPETWTYYSTNITSNDWDYMSGTSTMTWDCSTSDENGKTIEDICSHECEVYAPVGKWSFSSADCLERNKFQCNCKTRSNLNLCVNQAESSKIIDAECSKQCSLQEPVGKWTFSSADCMESNKFQCNCKMRIK